MKYMHMKNVIDLNKNNVQKQQQHQQDQQVYSFCGVFWIQIVIVKENNT